MLKLILIIGLSLTACGKSTPPCSISQREPELQAIYDKFQEATNVDPSCTQISFNQDLDNRSMTGLCNFDENTIYINPVNWEFYSDDYKEWVVVHELGHCVLGRDHKDAKIVNEYGTEIQTSLMSPISPSLYSSRYFKAHKADYYKELLTSVDF